MHILLVMMIMFSNYQEVEDKRLIYANLVFKVYAGLPYHFILISNK